MKRIPKKVLGVLGLILVAIMTIVAAAIPSAGVLAKSSVTDTIVVRVIGPSPDVNLTEPENGSVFLTPQHKISYNYENIIEATIVIDYTDKNGVLHAYVLSTMTITDEYGSGSIDLDLSEARFGFGEYVVRIFGKDDKGVTDEDAIKFSYYPFTATVEEDEETGDPRVDIEYDEGGDIDEFKINVYNESGNLVEFSPTTVVPPAKSARLPFADHNLPKGKYRIEIIAYKGGEELYNKVVLFYDYAPIPVPDTGSFFTKFNISRADYLITALIVFFAISLGSLYFIAKRKR